MIDYKKVKSGLGSIFSDLTTTSMSRVADLIDQYKADLSAKVGVFLQNDLKLRTAKSDIDTITVSSDPTINGTSGALLQQLGVLRTNQDSLMDSSTKLITALMDYKAYIQSTSPLKELIVGNMSISMITNPVQLAIITQAITDGISLTNQASTMVTAIDTQNAGVDRLVAQIADILGASRGAGTLPSLNEILTPVENLVGAAIKSPTWLYAVTALGAMLGVLYLTGAFKKKERKA